MNIEQLMESRDRIKKIMGNDEILIEFVKMVDFILTKPYKHVCQGIKEVKFEEIDAAILSLEGLICPGIGSTNAKNELDGWTDTLDILTNPEEMKLFKKSHEQLIINENIKEV
jgi:hypothetical protein